jgi:molybdopterin converting factor small subunit
VTVTISVRLNGPLAERLGHRRTITLPDAATTSDLLGALRDAAGGALPRVVTSIGGRIIDPAEPLADGADIAVLVPYAGG